MPQRRIHRRTFQLFKFDQPYLKNHGCIAGVDEAGCGPLAGPVVAAAVILSPDTRFPHLNDSKQLSSEQRDTLFALIQGAAVAFGVGIVEPEEIDRINIRQATFAAMRLALSRLGVEPRHVLVDGYRIPKGPSQQTAIIEGDAKSAHIAAASILAKVTRDAMMVAWDEQYPGYGFRNHKGYGTPEHLEALRRLGPTPIHRRSYAPVRDCLLARAPALSTINE
jgi:ribonuclease HII